MAIEQATGFDKILDYNNPETPIGPYTRNQYTQHPDGTRESSAFVKTVNFRPFTPRPSPSTTSDERNAVDEALQILFRGKTAHGVKYLKNGNCHEAFACKKIIVSAGIKSPSILLRSGIGPAGELMDAGIDVVKDNINVGIQKTKYSDSGYCIYCYNVGQPSFFYDNMSLYYKKRTIMDCHQTSDAEAIMPYNLYVHELNTQEYKSLLHYCGEYDIKKCDIIAVK